MELPDNIKTKHFLVCDDSEDMRRLMLNSLHALGIQKITVGKSGNEAFELLQVLVNAGTPVDYIISDMMMENGTGIDLAINVRKTSSTKDIPIMMVTSQADVKHVLEAVRAGVTSYILKPWADEELFKKLIEISTKKTVKG